MNLKKSLLVIFLLICITCSVSGVLAADVDANATLSETQSEDISLESPELDEKIMVNEESDLPENLETADNSALSATHVVEGKTFKDIQNAIDSANDGDIIELSGTYTGSSEIKIDKALTIKGNNAILDAKHTSRIMNCHDKKITLNNINFYNGCHDDGGAIQSDCELYITNCNFVNNIARGEYSSGSGGAISSYNNLNLKNCLFKNNKAESYQMGGTNAAIYCKKKIILNNCEFTKNQCDSGYWDNYNSQTGHYIISCGSLEAYNTKFIKNEGSIIDSTSSTLSKCTFKSNVGSCIQSSNVKISNCIFSNNDGKSDDALIELDCKKATISKCTFSKNKNNEIFHFGLPKSKNYGAVNIKISNSKFYKNKGVNYGGFIQYTSGVLKLNGWDIHDGKVVAKVKGHTYKAKLKSGIAKIKLTNLAKGTYKAVITYYGNKEYASYKVTMPITLKTSTIPKKLTLKTVKVKKSAKKLVLKATLKQGKTPLKSKKITFKFNGKSYKAKTNKKGIAKVTIKKKVLKKLKVGKKVKYQAKYGKLLVKKTAKVKK